MADDKIFANGLIVKPPRDTAPDFVKGSLSIKTEEFISFLEAHTKGDGWCNITIKESRGGKWYPELDTWVKGEVPRAKPKPETEEEDSPF